MDDRTEGIGVAPHGVTPQAAAASRGTGAASGAQAALAADIGAPVDDTPVTRAQPVHPYVHVVVVAVIGALATLAFLVIYERLNTLLWENDFVLANRWMFPVICLPFSLLVGLLVKYRHAPTTLNDSMLDTFGDDLAMEIRPFTGPASHVTLTP